MTSEADSAYNCVAHAAGKKDLPWWPMEEGVEGVFWPDGVDRAETVDAFVAAFRSIGYRPCEASQDGSGFIAGYEKVAIYVDAEGTPTQPRGRPKAADGPANSANGKTSNTTLRRPRRRQGGRPGYGKPVKYLIREIRDS